MEIKELVKYGLGNSLIKKLTELGFNKLTHIQQLAIEAGLFDGKSLLISAPTNTGKTLVGEFAAINTSIKGKENKAFYLVPLKALAEEKFEDFKEKYLDWGLKIAISTGERTEFDDNILENDIVIATYEKLSALIIKNPNLVKNTGVVIVDEIQNIGDEYRGTGLEILLTVLKKIREEKGPRIIGLSATIPNAGEIAGWLNAELVTTSKRETELHEGILYTGDIPIFFKGFELEKGDFLYKKYNTGEMCIEKKLDLEKMDNFRERCEKEQVIIFDNTKRKVEQMAINFASKLPAIKNVTKWIDELDSHVEPSPILRNLKKCILNSVAFHHAGLLRDEKNIIQKAFLEGDLKVICATTTLSTGVNTPAKTVIIRNYKRFDERLIEKRIYKNLSGRAGRIKFHDDFGRSVLFASNEKDLSFLWNQYIDTEPEIVQSQIHKHENLGKYIINLIATNICEKESDIIKFLENTFFGHSYYKLSSPEFRNIFMENMKNVVEDLVKEGFLSIKKGIMKATELGKMCSTEMLSPSSAKKIFNTLKILQKDVNDDNQEKFIETIIQLSLTLTDSDLLFPPYNTRQQERKELYSYWKLNKKNYLVDLDESVELDKILASTKTLQMLMRWIEGVPYSELVGFAPQGIIKSKAETASWLVKTISRFSGNPLFNFPKDFQRFIDILSTRILYGVPENAIDIMKLGIPTVHRFRAMNLAKGGFKDAESLIDSNIDDLKKVPEIGDLLANKIKHHVEELIENNNKRNKASQIRRARILNRDYGIIERLYSEVGDGLSRVCCEIFKNIFGINCEFIGDISKHEPDGLIETGNEKIVLECKRKTGKKLVSAKEAEEIFGKGKKYKPIANVTIGFPDFCREAKNNVINTNITLITHIIMGEILLEYWEGNLDKKDIINILKKGKYITNYDLQLSKNL